MRTLVNDAPEAADPYEHSPKMDEYSFGVLVVAKILPFQNFPNLKDCVQQQLPCTLSSVSHQLYKLTVK